MRVIFDNVNNVSLLKQGTSERRSRKSEGTRSYVEEDSTCVRDEITLIASDDTKDRFANFVSGSATQSIIVLLRTW